MFSATSVNLCEDDGEYRRPDKAAKVAEKSEYFSMHVPNLPHSSCACFGQCCPGGQHSDCAAMTDEPSASVRISAPATGSITTEREIKATSKVRTKLMASIGLPATFHHGQVTEP